MVEQQLVSSKGRMNKRSMRPPLRGQDSNLDESAWKDDALPSEQLMRPRRILGHTHKNIGCITACLMA